MNGVVKYESKWGRNRERTGSNSEQKKKKKRRIF
jgi:hypothetical protein